MTIDTFEQAGNTRMVIEPKGLWEHSAYQTDNRFTIEVKPIQEDPNRLTQGTRAGYKGEKLSLNFQNVEVRAVLQVIADFTGLNIITSDTVTGSLTLRLKDIPWDQALDIIMQTKGLDMRKNGNVVLIAPREELAVKEKQQLEAQLQISELEPLQFECFELNYIRAQGLAHLLQSNKQQEVGIGAGQTPPTGAHAPTAGTCNLPSWCRGWSYGGGGGAGGITRRSPRAERAAPVEGWQWWQRVAGYADPVAALNPFDATIATGTDRTSLVKIGGQWTHLINSNIEGNINGGWVNSFATHSGIVATVTGDGTVVPTMGNRGWFEYGGRLGFRLTQGWVADLFVNGTLGPQPVGTTIHGGVGLRVHY